MELDTQEEGIQDFHELESLAEAGKYEEALKKHIWFHEASKKMPGMGGVRLSYALDLWLKLSEKYNPAMEALVDLRDCNKKVLLNGNGSFENFHDLSAINHVLEDNEGTLLVFNEIHNHYPKQAHNYYHVIENLLVEAQAYDVCASYIGDPIEKFSHLKHLHEMNVKILTKNPEMDDDEFREYTESSYVNGVCQLIEIMVALGKADQAKEVQSLALAYLENKSIREAISS